MMTKIYAAGWVLQKPNQNFFKRFIHLNPSLSLSGIVYPKKVPDNIEGIPVFDFNSAREVIGSQDVVLDVSANPAIRKELQAFFEAKDIRLTAVEDFLDRAISADQQDALRLPFVGISTRDIRKLKETRAPNMADAHFLDFESHDVASKLDVIFRAAEWARLLEFDCDETPGNVLFNLMRDLQERGVLKHLSVQDTPQVFLNTILKIKLHYPDASFTIALSPNAVEELGARVEFYRRSLADCLVPFGEDDATRQKHTIVLSGSADPVIAASKGESLQPAIFFMQRSIIDYAALREVAGDRQFRMLLRQPDTMPHNLIAAVLTPEVLGA
jgi:hypothetical protein